MARESKEKPGVMLYFETMAAAEALSDEQRGKLYSAVYEYACFGKAPSFSDSMLSLAWAFFAPKIVADDERYTERALRNSYAAYCREENKATRNPVPFNEWAQDHPEKRRASPLDITRCQTTSHDIKRYPTQSQPNSVSVSTPTPVSVSASTSTPASTPNIGRAFAPPSSSTDPDSPSAERKRFTPPTLDEVRAYCMEKGYSVDAALFLDFYQARGWRLSRGLPMRDWKAAVRTWARRDKEEQEKAKPKNPYAWMEAGVS